MNRLIFVLLAAMVMVFAAGCTTQTGQDAADPTSGQAAEVDQQAAEELANPDDGSDGSIQSYTLTEQAAEIVDVAKLDKSTDGAITSYAFADLEPGQAADNDTDYEISGGEQLSFQINWSPMGCPVGVGLRDVESGTMYIATIESGTGTGRIPTADIPAGKYNIVVFNVGAYEENVEGVIAFNW